MENYTINIMQTKLDNLVGYAFIDISSHCIIIVWGETNRDKMIKKLNK